MMPKVYRLRSSRSFDVVYKKGKSIADSTLVLTTLASKYPQPKVGFVVGKKVGKAVYRNRVKRRLRAIFASLLPRVEGHTSYIVVARTGSVDRTYAQLEQSLTALLVKAGKLHRT